MSFWISDLFFNDVLQVSSLSRGQNLLCYRLSFSIGGRFNEELGEKQRQDRHTSFDTMYHGRASISNKHRENPIQWAAFRKNFEKHDP
jgi:hypothetical protein